MATSATTRGVLLAAILAAAPALAQGSPAASATATGVSSAPGTSTSSVQPAAAADTEAAQATSGSRPSAAATGVPSAPGTSASSVQPAASAPGTPSAASQPSDAATDAASSPGTASARPADPPSASGTQPASVTATSPAAPPASGAPGTSASSVQPAAPSSASAPDAQATAANATTTAPSDAQATPPSDSASSDSTIDVAVRGRRADTIRRASSSSTTVGEKELREAQPQNSGEMLRRIPGVQVRQEDPSGLRLNIGIRGLSPVRSRLVLMEEDGVPLVVSPYGEPELYYSTDVERVQRLDVIKGSDVLLHGPQTVGAAIELHTWDPTLDPKLTLSATGGAYGFGEGLLRYSDTTNGVGYVAQALYKRSDGVRAMGFDVADAFTKVRFATSDRGELTLKVAFHDELSKTTYTGLTDLLYRQDPAQNTIAPDDNFGIQRTEAAASHVQHLSSALTLRSALFAYSMTLDQRQQDFDRARLPGVDYTRIPDPTALFFRDTTTLRHRLYEVAGLSEELEARATTGALAHKVILGGRMIGEDAHRQLSSGAFPTAESGNLITDDDTAILGLSGWVEDQISYGDWLVVTPGFRVEHSHSVKTTNRIADNTQAPHDVHLVGKSDSTGLMPGIGLGVGSPRLTGFLNVYRGYSAPRVSQAITPGGQDAQLDAEHSTNFELGARGRVGRFLRAEANAFLINFDNQLVSNNPLSGYNSEFINGGRTRHVGAEATAILRVGALAQLPLELDLAGHYTFARSRFVGGTFAGHTLPYSPEHTAQVTLDADLRSGLSAEAALTWVGPQYTDEINTVEAGPTGLDGRLDGYAVLDLGVKYQYRPAHLTLGVALKNALNQIYISDRLPNGIFTAGFRQLFVTLSWTTGG